MFIIYMKESKNDWKVYIFLSNIDNLYPIKGQNFISTEKLILLNVRI